MQAGDAGAGLRGAPLFPVFLLLLLHLPMVLLPALTPAGLGSREGEEVRGTGHPGDHDVPSLPLKGRKGLFLLGLLSLSFASSETLALF